MRTARSMSPLDLAVARLDEARLGPPSPVMRCRQAATSRCIDPPRRDRVRRLGGRELLERAVEPALEPAGLGPGRPGQDDPLLLVEPSASVSASSKQVQTRRVPTRARTLPRLSSGLSRLTGDGPALATAGPRPERRLVPATEPLQHVVRSPRRQSRTCRCRARRSRRSPRRRRPRPRRPSGRSRTGCTGWRTHGRPARRGRAPWRPPASGAAAGSRPAEPGRRAGLGVQRVAQHVGAGRAPRPARGPGRATPDASARTRLG